MLEPNESMLPPLTRGKTTRVITVGFEQDSTEELHRLLKTLGVDPVFDLHVNQKQISAATYIGKGKVEELLNHVKQQEADAVIIDTELSPNQVRNIEKIIGKVILDRPGVIIEIFSQHARTKEAKTQVELARLQYLLPRLTGLWTHFERQRGGGATSRGMGEKQIEVDKRLLKDRMNRLKSKLKEIQKERGVRRSNRAEVLQVAFVGYTNAGKSTLLNALTQSNVIVENKLFSTLDSYVRALDPHSHPPMVAIDTVGFIKKLPPSLIASFRSTLEELGEADLLVHVIDASSISAQEELETTVEILKELGLDQKPRLIVLNKMDLVKSPSELNWVRMVAKGSLRVSALNPENVAELRKTISQYFVKNLDLFEVMIPYSESKMEAQIHEYGVVEIQKFLDKGTFFRVRMEASWAEKLGLKKYQM